MSQMGGLGMQFEQFERTHQTPSGSATVFPGLNQYYLAAGKVLLNDTI